MLRAVDALERFAASIKSGLRRRAINAGVLACALVAFLISGGFVIAAGYLALARDLPPHLAALGIAAALALLGGLLLLIGKLRRRRTTSSITNALQDGLTSQVEQLTDRVAAECVNQIRQKPSSALLTAAVLGVVVGLMRRDPPP